MKKIIILTITSILVAILLAFGIYYYIYEGERHFRENSRYDCYTVTYDVGKYGVPIEADIVLKGHAPKLPTPKCKITSVGVDLSTNERVVMDDYAFKGWKYDGIIYKPGDEFPIFDENITLVAVWSPLWTKPV